MINFIKKLIRKKIYYTGPYARWEEAKVNSTGYNSNEIFEKVRKSAFYVKNHKKGYERDSIITYDDNYDNYLIKILDIYSKKKNKTLKILDFGGSLGSLYFYYKDKINNKFNWSIIEQKKFVKEGRRTFQNSELYFFNSIEEYKKTFLPDIIIASSSLQYLENYKDILNKILNLNPDYIIILKTPFDNKMFDEIYVQKPPKNVYNSTYPSWIFSYETFLINFRDKFVLEEKKIVKPEFFQLKYLNLYFRNRKIKNV